MYQFNERGMRGGVSYICKRYGVTNNNYGKNYDPGKESSDIMHLHANSLYGWAMSQPLLTGDFKWVDVTVLDPENYDENGGRV